jgi:hypothetical protein
VDATAVVDGSRVIKPRNKSEGRTEPRSGCLVLLGSKADSLNNTSTCVDSEPIG